MFETFTLIGNEYILEGENYKHIHAVWEREVLTITYINNARNSNDMLINEKRVSVSVFLGDKLPDDYLDIANDTVSK